MIKKKLDVGVARWLLDPVELATKFPLNYTILSLKRWLHWIDIMDSAFWSILSLGDNGSITLDHRFT